MELKNINNILGKEMQENNSASLNIEWKQSDVHEEENIDNNVNAQNETREENKKEVVINKEKPVSNKKSNKVSNSDWKESIPEDERPKQGNIYYLVPNNKFGRFVDFGKKEGIYYLSMFKKNSFDTMSKDWSVKSELLIPVEIDGVIIDDRFDKTENGYVLKDNVSLTKEAVESKDKVENDNITE